MDKYLNMINSLKNMKKAIIAFSGGVDSTFLLYACKEALGENITALTIQTPYIAQWEIEESKELTKELGIEHKILKLDIPESIINNPIDRCYLCKKTIFDNIKSYAEKNGIEYILDGSNFDDTKDYRPGMKALKELEIRSPLLENEFTKKEIRELSQTFNLKTWDKPAYACLLTRLPYGDKIEADKLTKIEKSEKILMDMGFKAVRVRCHDDLARIELDSSILEEFLKKDNFDKVSEALKRIGFRYVTLDLSGYKMGSFNN